jgi:MFS family permease
MRLNHLLPDAGPARILTINQFVGSTGTGLFLTGSVLYYTRVVGLSVTQVGLGLSIAGALGILGSLSFGAAAQRFGPRRAMIALHLSRVVTYAALAFVQNFWQFLLVIALATACDRSSPAGNQALVGRIFTKAERVRTVAFMRAVSNIGMGTGALLAGIAVQMDTPLAYRLAVLGNALSFLPMAVVVAKLRRYEREPEVPTPARDAGARPARHRPLRDVPFAALSLSNGLMLLHDSVLFVALPLFIVDHTNAPRFMVAVALVVNTVLTALGQVWWTRLAATVAAAARSMVTAAMILAGAALTFGAASYGSAVVASVLIVVGVVLQTGGENLHSAAAWELSFDLSPPDAQASYLGMFNAGSNAQSMYGPPIATTLGVHAGPAGWIGLGALYLFGGAASRGCVRWIQTARAGQIRGPVAAVPEVAE